MRKMDALQIYAAFFNMIEVLDNYKLFKNPDGTHAIDVEIKNHKQSFKANDVYDLMNLLGDWLCKLPKSTWAEFN